MGGIPKECKFPVYPPCRFFPVQVLASLQCRGTGLFDQPLQDRVEPLEQLDKLRGARLGGGARFDIDYVKI